MLAWRLLSLVLFTATGVRGAWNKKGSDPAGAEDQLQRILTEMQTLQSLVRSQSARLAILEEKVLGTPLAAETKQPSKSALTAEEKVMTEMVSKEQVEAEKKAAKAKAAAQKKAAAEKAAAEKAAAEKAAAAKAKEAADRAAKAKATAEQAAMAKAAAAKAAAKAAATATARRSNSKPTVLSSMPSSPPAVRPPVSALATVSSRELKAIGSAQLGERVVAVAMAPGSSASRSAVPAGARFVAAADQAGRLHVLDMVRLRPHPHHCHQPTLVQNVLGAL